MNALLTAALVLAIAALIFSLWVDRNSKPTEAGRFVINHSDPTKDLCMLELDIDIDEIEAAGVISLDVVTIDEITTKE